MKQSAIATPGAGSDGMALAQACIAKGETVTCGDLRAARYLAPFAMTWIHMALKLGHGRRFAFARLRR